MNPKGLPDTMHNAPTRLRRAAATLIALTLATLGLTITAPASKAGTYHHLSLNYAGYANSDGWSAHADHQGRGYVASTLHDTRTLGLWNVDGGRPGGFQFPEYTSFVYDAPADTTISHIYWTDRISGLGVGPWQHLVADDSHSLVNSQPAPNAQLLREADVSGTRVAFALSCAGPASCYSGANATYQIDTVDVTINDTYPPLAGAASGRLIDGSKLTDSASITYSANDAGSGVYRTVFFDGTDVVDRAAVNTNYGHCVDVSAAGRLFDRQIPCLLSTTASASLDTTQLDDGFHTIKVAVEDAAGNLTTVYGPVTKLVANHPPVNTAPPAVAPGSGAAGRYAGPVAGDMLQFPDGGTWTGPNLTMAHAWVRCDADGNACGQIPGALGLNYAVTQEDVGHRLRLAATATNVADSVTAYSAPSGIVTAAKSTTDGSTAPVTSAPTSQLGVTLPTLPTSTTTTTSTTIERDHTFVGHVVGEPAGVPCPADKATLRFEHVSGGRMGLRYGRASTAQVVLVCTNTGKAIANAKLDIATKTGAAAAVASDVTTDGAGHAILRIAAGASRGITVGYRMYADDALARATATLKVLVTGRVALKSDRRRLRNGQAVTLRGKLAGGNVPHRGVTLAVQWKDGQRWRPFAQIRTNAKGSFRYAYRFTRTSRRIRYQLRVQITKGQLDYPFEAVASNAVKVDVVP